MSELIRPEDLINELSLEGLNETSDAYFRDLPDPRLQMGKPFTMPENVPHTLEGLAMIARGLRLTRSMKVVDFGAGTCWLTRYLVQMGCDPIAVDVSSHALGLGQRLLQEFPPCAPHPGAARFLVYDGRTIDLPDDSVDRIICFDSFHHVPNPEEVLAEFYRILKPSGLIGFHEPGLGHSQTLESQKEMRDFKVLENDVDKFEIFRIWQGFGPGEFRTFFHAGLEVELDDRELRKLEIDPESSAKLMKRLLDVNRVDNIFFLSKGPFLLDSRVKQGLRAKIKVKLEVESANPGQWLEGIARVTNQGSSRWLAIAEGDFGAVGLGAHLRTQSGEIVEYDFLRVSIPHDVAPGESVDLSLRFAAPEMQGQYSLEFDLVAGWVCWFGELESPVLVIDLEVLG